MTGCDAVMLREFEISCAEMVPWCEAVIASMEFEETGRVHASPLARSLARKAKEAVVLG